jgi:3-deoxy-D-manno-octulosonate 8-phosphate phosphatase (KDO 8-P phosphatase)
VVSRLLTAPERAHGLTTEELVARALRLRLVLSDCDGVLTDGTVYVSEAGEAMKRFSLKDGMGVERLRDAEIETAIVTREHSPIVARRAEKLGLGHHFEGVHDKAADLPRILAACGCALDEVAYIGDDVNDLEILEAVSRSGLTAVPFDAAEEVVGAAHLRCRERGGLGAFREFAEWILRLRGAGLRGKGGLA